MLGCVASTSPVPLPSCSVALSPPCSARPAALPGVTVGVTVAQELPGEDGRKRLVAYVAPAARVDSAAVQAHCRCEGPVLNCAPLSFHTVWCLHMGGVQGPWCRQVWTGEDMGSQLSFLLLKRVLSCWPLQVEAAPCHGACGGHCVGRPTADAQWQSESHFCAWLPSLPACRDWAGAVLGGPP